METRKYISIVIDDAERYRTDPYSRCAMREAAKTGAIQFEPSVSLNLPDYERSEMSLFFASLGLTPGLHLVLDEAPQNEIYWGKGSLFGSGGVLDRQRKLYEWAQRKGLSQFAWAISRLTASGKVQAETQRTIDKQVNQFHDVFGSEPAHLTFHNGWDFHRAVSGAMHESQIPFRMNRQRMPNWISDELAISPFEKGLVIDEHNVRGLTHHLRTPGEFVGFILQSLGSQKGAEVVMHVHAGMEPHYTPHSVMIASSDFAAELAQAKISTVSSRTLIMQSKT